MTNLPPPPRRWLPGTITREAPPGPEMTREQFELAVEDATHDAARWRWLMRNFQTVLGWPLERWAAFEVQSAVDNCRK